MPMRDCKRVLVRRMGISIARQIAGTFALLWLSISTAFAQTWQLGRYQMLHGFASAPLRVSMGAASLSRMSFLSAVGGVAFQGVARPTTEIGALSVTLDYDASQTDGYRLAVHVGDRVFHPYLPDWELKPIAYFAASPYHSVVSLFGPKTDRHNFHVVYHSAFQNTLVGMRLLQADMLLMDAGEFWQLPRLDGQLVLGNGEAAPSSRASSLAARSIDSIMATAEAQSWVLTDQGVPMTFGVNGGKFVVSGTPYYYFWKLDSRYARQSDSLRLLALAALRRGDSVRAVSYLESLERLRPAASGLSELTETFRDRPYLLHDLNPAVYAVVTNTARYGAFFRYVRQQDHANWNAFLAQLRGVPVLPAVATPTQIPKPSATDEGR